MMLQNIFLTIVITTLLLVASSTAEAQRLSLEDAPDLGEITVDKTWRGRVRAPELAGGRSWLNSERPLTLQGLRGKIVLLDFWTYGCINCVHIIPEIKKLEAKYANQLIVIGVHSAKFENEKETENIRRIITRYEVEHPVVNDADFQIWNNYAVNAYPTLMLIDPAGYVVGKVVGEGNTAQLDAQINLLAAEFRSRGQLDEKPLKFALEKAKQAPMPLQFPGKISVDEKGARLFISDSNHNRIIVTKLDGTLQDIIGAGTVGRADGAFQTATFYRPQGTAYDARTDALYVADTENHLIRKIDFKLKKVSTLAGTGAQLFQMFERGKALESALSSPWDLQLIDDKLFVAMAGTHQIWQIDLSSNIARLYAGSVRWREARADGALLESAFAQPSGLTTDGKNLYVADSESNIIRRIELNADNTNDDEAENEVETLVGGDLYVFGDRDGTGDDARLQHPLGIAFHDENIFIADTYNHKIKRLDSHTRTVETFVGTGAAGHTDTANIRDNSQSKNIAAQFYEPGGIAYARGKLYVADTNNNAIRTVDVKTKQVATLAIKGLQPPAVAVAQMSEAERETAADNVLASRANEIILAPQIINRQAKQIVVDVRLPQSYHLNELAPHRYSVAITSGANVVALTETANKQAVSHTAKNLRLPLHVPVQVLADGRAELRFVATLYYCRDDNTGACLIKTLAWRVPVQIEQNAATHEIKIEGEIKLE